MKSLLRIFLLLGVVYGCLVVVVGCAAVQRKLLYFPSHIDFNNGLGTWWDGDQLIGYFHEVREPKTVWLLLHGNGGQAAHRAYTLSRFSLEDSIYILEYPGYGLRGGEPSTGSINAAARRAYAILSQRFPHTPLCVVGESLGSGPAYLLASEPRPPAKIVLIVPYDELIRVAADHYPYLPVRSLMHDNWDNVAALAAYQGPIDIFAGTDDTVIPNAHARTLAASKPQARLTLYSGGHNDWSGSFLVKIQYP